MQRVNIESLFPGVFPVYINHVIARLPSKRHPWCLQRYQSSPTSRLASNTFSTQKKRRSPVTGFLRKTNKRKTLETHLIPPKKFSMFVCYSVFVFFPLKKETSGMPMCFTEPGPSTHLESASFLRCQETSWSTYSSGSGLSTSARAESEHVDFSRNISWFQEFHWLIYELLN